MVDNSGRYLVCITRKNGDFYRYEVFDEIYSVINLYNEWLGNRTSSHHQILEKAATSKIIEDIGIRHSPNHPNLYLVDLAFEKEPIGSAYYDVEGKVAKFKRIKRLYNINTLGI